MLLAASWDDGPKSWTTVHAYRQCLQARPGFWTAL